MYIYVSEVSSIEFVSQGGSAVQQLRTWSNSVDLALARISIAQIKRAESGGVGAIDPLVVLPWYGGSDMGVARAAA